MIGLSFLLIVGALIWAPYAHDSILQICIARVLLGAGAQIQLGNPLVNDYVRSESRGVATTYQNIGWIVGEIFAFAVLFNFTKAMTLTASFHIAAASLAFWGIITTLSIRKHVTKKMRLMMQTNGTNSIDSDVRASSIRARVKEVIKGEIGYLIVFLGCF